MYGLIYHVYDKTTCQQSNRVAVKNHVQFLIKFICV